MLDDPVSRPLVRIAGRHFDGQELSTVSESLARVDVGTAIGQLRKGVSQPSIQADFDRELQRLKLEKYRTAVQQEVELDLRENRRVKSKEAAFLDLHRSSFLHRLCVLWVSFAKPGATRQESATWAEKWLLQWTPESEIELVTLLAISDQGCFGCTPDRLPDLIAAVLKGHDLHEFAERVRLA